VSKKPAVKPRTLGVVSDTHGHLLNTRKAIEMLKALEVDVVVHCGDLGSAEIVPLFAPWPTHFVLGNVDFDSEELARAVTAAGQHFHDRFAQIEVGSRKIAVVHGDDSAALDGAITGGKFDLVCTGHTHVARQYRHGETLVLNPGALYRANPHTLAIVDLEKFEATHVRVD
jgi:putative phosphoesterase